MTCHATAFVRQSAGKPGLALLPNLNKFPCRRVIRRMPSLDFPGASASGLFWGVARQARQAGRGWARLGMARRGKAGEARLGEARHGAARQGEAGQAF